MKAISNITLVQDGLVIDGVLIAYEVIPQMFYELTHPDPRKWYRFERAGDTIIVHVRISETPEAFNGNGIATFGAGTQGSHQQGEQTAHGGDAPAPDSE